MNVYRTTFTAFCPVNDHPIVYALEVRTEEVLSVEDIEKVCEFDRPILHEEAADILSATFGGEQRLVAKHGRVQIETLRP